MPWSIREFKGAESTIGCMASWFRSSASVTVPDVLFYFFSLVNPGVLMGQEFQGFGNSRVSCGKVVMVLLEESAFSSMVSRKDL